MKNMRILLGLSLLTLVIAFTGCKKDEEEVVIDPSLTVTCDDADGKVVAGQKVSFTWDARKGSSDLKTFTIMKDDAYPNDTADVSYNAVAVSSGDAHTGTTKFTISSGAAGTAYVYKFTITDKDGISVSKSITLTVEVIVTIDKWSSKVLGAQGSASPSFMASSTGILYSASSDTTSIKANANITYAIYSTTPTILSVPSRKTLFVGSLSGGLACYFGPSLKTSTEFNAITDDSFTISVNTSDNQYIDNLSAGDVIEFLTASNKKGLILVNSITPGTTGSIDISVIVQK